MHDIRQFIRNKYYNLSLGSKLILSYCVVTIIPMAIFIYILYSNISASEENKMEYSSNQSFEQAYSIINSRIRYVNNVVDFLFMDEQLQRIANTHSYDYFNDFGQQLIDSDRLMKQIMGLEKREGIVKLKLYIDKRIVLSNENKTYFSIESIQDTIWYNIITANRNKTLWCPTEYFDYEGKSVNELIPVVRIIKDKNNLNKNMGILRLDISKNEIFNILVKSKVSPNTNTYIFNKKGEIICSSKKQNETDINILQNLRDQETDRITDKDWSIENINNKDYRIKVKSFEGTDWRIYMMIPLTDVYASSKSIRYKLIVTIFCVMVIAYLMAFLISRTNTHRLKGFIKLMKSAEKGDFNLKILPNYNDEIGYLSKHFNVMLTKISMLIDHEVKLGQKVQAAELKALHSQINPHFLYNTLDLINWFSLMGRDEELREVVVSLSRFYKLSLNKGEEFVSLENEIEHVKAYVDIQNKRFAEKISLVINLDEDIKQARVLKIILQPIVENAIMHGIMQKSPKEGTITITGKKIGNDLVIIVQDDGIGIGDERLKEIQQPKFESVGSAYGIRNIKERISMLYGEQYGLTYESSIGVGTKVKITFPDKE